MRNIRFNILFLPETVYIINNKNNICLVIKKKHAKNVTEEFCKAFVFNSTTMLLQITTASEIISLLIVVFFIPSKPDYYFSLINQGNISQTVLIILSYII